MSFDFYPIIYPTKNTYFSKIRSLDKFSYNS